VTVVNHGTIEANVSRRSLSFKAAVTNAGTMRAVNNSTLDLVRLQVDPQGYVAGDPLATISIAGDLVGGTQSHERFAPWSAVLFDGSGTAEAPQTLEALSGDLGPDAEGFRQNFALSELALSNSTYLRLVDESDNAAPGGAEAVYVNSLKIPSGATLDLNGLHLYVRAAEVAGVVVGGAVTPIADGGPMVFGLPASGSIAVGGEVDAWTFSAGKGDTLRVVVNPGSTRPGSFVPYVGYVRAQLLGPDGTNLAQAASNVWGGVLTLPDTTLPADGVYRLEVRARDDRSTSVGNYLLTVTRTAIGEPAPPPPPDPTRNPWHNYEEPGDVDGSGDVAALDVLVLINHLNEHGARRLPTPDSPDTAPPPYLDTNNDGHLRPLDALLVINLLNRRGRGQAEGEGTADSDADAMIEPEPLRTAAPQNSLDAAPATAIPGDSRQRDHAAYSVPASHATANLSPDWHARLWSELEGELDELDSVLSAIAHKVVDSQIGSA
jgi:hypothetical protein